VKKYARLLKNVERVLVVDSVGNGPAKEERDPRILNLAFPVPGLKRKSLDLVTIEGDIDKMMEVYQSELDTTELVTEKNLQSARTLALRLITSSSRHNT
jgi:hypothetical protein